MSLDRFRYRVWHKGRENPKMIYPESLDEPQPKWNMGYVREALQEVWQSNLNDNLIIMQCWGRKDSRGTLVYEGDVVKLSYPDAHIPYEELYEVRFGEFEYGCMEYGWYLYQNPRYVRPLRLSDVQERMTVLGNIYESKHTVEEKSQ